MLETREEVMAPGGRQQAGRARAGVLEPRSALSGLASCPLPWDEGWAVGWEGFLEGGDGPRNWMACG